MIATKSPPILLLYSILYMRHNVTYTKVDTNENGGELFAIQDIPIQIRVTTILQKYNTIILIKKLRFEYV